jgi:hypothetical protein
MPKSSKGRAKPRAYTGDLAEPIYEPILWASISEDLDRRKWQAEQRAINRQLANLKSLFDWYKIDPSADDQWASLAFELAKAHVPGMRVIYDWPPKRGRRRSWQAGRYEELLQDVHEVRSKREMTTSAAIDALRADDSRDWRKFNRNSLIARHREAVREHKSLHVFAKDLKLKLIPHSTDLGPPSDPLFANLIPYTTQLNTLPLKLQFKQRPTK